VRNGGKDNASPKTGRRSADGRHLSAAAAAFGLLRNGIVYCERRTSATVGRLALPGLGVLA